MAVWANKTNGVDRNNAADVNQIASGFGAAYNFGTDTTVKQLASAHATGGTHDDTIVTNDLQDGAVTLGKMAGLASGKIILGNGSGDPAAVTPSGDVTISNTGVTTIANAAVTLAKMANLADGKIILGDGSNRPAAVTPSGDVTISNAGVTAIGNAKVTLAMMAALNSGKIILGDGSNRPAAVTPSGDVTISNAGVTAIGAGKVTETMLAASVAGDGLTGGGGSPLAVNADNSTVAIASDAVKVKDGGIGPTQIASGYGLLTSTQKTDLTDGGYTTLHHHSASFDYGTVIWTEGSLQASNDVDAPAMPELGAISTSPIIRARVVAVKTPEWDMLCFRGEYYAVWDGANKPRLTIYNATTAESSADYTTAAHDNWTQFDQDNLILDCSGLTNGLIYEFHLLLKRPEDVPQLVALDGDVAGGVSGGITVATSVKVRCLSCMVGTLPPP